MPFNSENLTIFLTVLEKGSFSAAARALHRVPSAVSMAIANLEAELGFCCLKGILENLSLLKRPFL